MYLSLEVAVVGDCSDDGVLLVAQALIGYVMFCAGAAMAFSSVSVVVSSLMLRTYKRPPPVLRDIALQ